MNKIQESKLLAFEDAVVKPALVWEGDVRERVVVSDCGSKVVVRYYDVSDIEHQGDEDCVRQACNELVGKSLDGVTVVHTVLEFASRYDGDGDGVMVVRGSVMYEFK